jgi:hypothetical protein
MATTARAYRNPDGEKSAKKGLFLSRAEIAELIEAADFSRDREATIIRRSGREKGNRHYRRGHLVSALKGIWRAATSPFGTGEILCFASVEGYAIEAVTSERAMRYKLRELERIGIIELVYAANTIRRPATYRLNISKLRERCRRTYQDVKNSRPAPTPLRPRSSHTSHRSSSDRSSPPAQAAAASPNTAAAPVPVASSYTQIIARQPSRTRRDCKKVLERMLAFTLPAIDQDENNGGALINYIADLGDQLQEICRDVARSLDGLARKQSHDRRPKGSRIDPVEIENHLSAIEETLIADLAKRTDENQLTKISVEAARQCRQLMPTQTDAQRAETTRKLANRLLLEQWRAPRLSLFYMPFPGTKQIDRQSNMKIAFHRACESLHFTPESVREGMKYWGFAEIKFEEAEPSP